MPAPSLDVDDDLAARDITVDRAHLDQGVEWREERFELLLVLRDGRVQELFLGIQAASLEVVHGELRMQAGMPAEVYVRTDSRTVLDYLLAPVTAYLRRAMREPV